MRCFFFFFFFLLRRNPVCPGVSVTCSALTRCARLGRLGGAPSARPLVPATTEWGEGYGCRQVGQLGGGTRGCLQTSSGPLDARSFLPEPTLPVLFGSLCKLDPRKFSPLAFLLRLGLRYVSPLDSSC